MPLPAALAARLAKRGIISKKSAQQQSAKNPEEEVFAESYDDQEDVTAPKSNVNTNTTPAKIAMVTNAEAMEQIKFMGYPCCPNKWNIYHECTTFCQNHWNKKRSTGPEPESEYANKHKAMMEVISLPEEWQEKWDPGTGRHYYWCTRTDKVSWLPPGHPKAKITEAASHVREMIQNQIHMEPDNEDDESEDEEEDDEHAMDLDSDMESDHEEEERLRREREKRKLEKRKEDKRKEDKRKDPKSKGRDSGKIDPMDPSSYSDTPRGNWSSGLEKEDGGRAIHGPAQGDV